MFAYKQTLKCSLSFRRIKIDLLNQEYTVYYVGTNLGRVYKIVQFYRNSEPHSKLLDIFEIATDEPIQVMEISQTRKSLYVATDNRIKQIDLAMCNRRYDSCYRCVKDPYCGWDKEANVCRPYELGLLQVSVTQELESNHDSNFSYFKRQGGPILSKVRQRHFFHESRAAEINIYD